MAAALVVEAALRGGHAWWVGPTYQMAGIGWREIKGLAKQIPGTEVSEVERRVTFPGGGWVQARSADNPDSLRGEGLDFVVLDEAAFVDESAWTEAIRPALADRQGRALIISTPKGRNWFWRAFQAGQDTTQAEWRSWQAPTSSSPFIVPSEIDAARAGLPERVFRQEFLAEFTEDGGGVFRGVREAATARKLDGPEKGHRYVAGLDLAKLDDFSVLTVLDDETGEVVLVDRFNGVDYTVQRGRVQAAHAKWGFLTLLAERNSIGEPFIEELVRLHIPVQPFTTTHASKAQIVDALALAFERRDLRIPNDPVLVGELEAYEMERLPGGTFRYNAPAGLHDDCVISLALAWFAHAGLNTGRTFVARFKTLFPVKAEAA